MSADNQTAVFLGDKVLAQAMTSDLEKVEGNWYFKESALIDRSKFTPSETHTHCGWKGDASYFNYTKDDGEVIKDIAWFYPTPMKGAEAVAGRVAFYVGKVPGLKIGVPSV
ncbi:hypothetical protein DB88DRAFT_493352 [Papiliotrema laurentii]|uniref:DUF427 domain-containing protein n=1 Tax=Papiliotrema laurentii TaxID=5418 RepID=A0AAD9D1B5_PAPLA|nr:hypothetical protein DB88DRAFT_493352 [Papiliotrema laurentii]